MGSVESAIVDTLEADANAKNKRLLAQKNELFAQAVFENDPEKRKSLMDQAKSIEIKRPQFREQYELGSEYRKKYEGSQF